MASGDEVDDADRESACAGGLVSFVEAFNGIGNGTDVTCEYNSPESWKV